MMEPEEKEKNELNELEKSKFVEFYSQSYASFYNTTMEKDKSILTVSAGGIGFIITLISLTKNIGVLEYMLFLFSSLSFLTAIFTIIHIFGKNADYIVSLVTDAPDLDEKECKLKFFDKIATSSFSIGILLAFVLGMSTSYKNITVEKEMAKTNLDSSKANSSGHESASSASLIKKSFTGASLFKPTVNTGSSSSNPSGNSSPKASNSSTQNSISNSNKK